MGISKGKFFFKAYKNRIFGGTSDYMGLYKFDSGKDGFVTGFGALSFTAVNSENLYYLTYSTKTSPCFTVNVMREVITF